MRRSGYAIVFKASRWVVVARAMSCVFNRFFPPILCVVHTTARIYGRRRRVKRHIFRIVSLCVKICDTQAETFGGDSLMCTCFHEPPMELRVRFSFPWHHNPTRCNPLVPNRCPFVFTLAVGIVWRSRLWWLRLGNISTASPCLVLDPDRFIFLVGTTVHHSHQQIQLGVTHLSNFRYAELLGAAFMRAYTIEIAGYFLNMVAKIPMD